MVDKLDNEGFYAYFRYTKLPNFFKDTELEPLIENYIKACCDLEFAVDEMLKKVE